MIRIPTFAPALDSAPDNETQTNNETHEGDPLVRIEVGMSCEQVERIMHRKRYSSIIAGAVRFTWYPESNLSIAYADGKVISITRR